VALELQADFYAGVWTHYNQQMNTILEDGDIDEALSAAHAVGDAIQSKMQGHIVPESLHTEPLNNANIGLKAIKPVTLIKVILMHRDKDTTIKIETNPYFFTFYYN
jgi:hypothetical protein